MESKETASERSAAMKQIDPRTLPLQLGWHH